IQHPEIYSQAERDQREKLMRSFDYDEQHADLVKELQTVQRQGSYQPLYDFLYATVYRYGQNSSLGVAYSGFYGFHHNLMEKGLSPKHDPAKKWKSPYIRFLNHVLNLRLIEDRPRPEANVYVDTASITLNWLSAQREIW